VTPAQWALLAAVSGNATPRDLAGRLGDSVFRAVCRAHDLVVLGLIGTSSGQDFAGRRFTFLESWVYADRAGARCGPRPRRR
jgi:hypothetical protein